MRPRLPGTKQKKKTEEGERIRKKIKNAEEKIDKVEDKLGHLLAIKKKAGNYSNILDDVHRTIPGKVWITQLNVEDDNLKITGGAYSMLLLTQFMDNLQNAPFFANANFINTKKDEIENVEVINFEITCGVTGGL